MKHAMVVGGTGMLKEASIWINRQGYHLTVIARNKNRLLELGQDLEFPERYSPLSLDYFDYSALRAGIKEVQTKHDPIKLVVSGTGSSAPDVLRCIINELDEGENKKWDLYHILGSGSDLKKVKDAISPPLTCNYRQIKLGFVIENNNSRWLTHHEISSGVINSFLTEEPVTIVGTLEPWYMRPKLV
jgi:hypothetical protein